MRWAFSVGAGCGERVSDCSVAVTSAHPSVIDTTTTSINPFHPPSLPLLTLPTDRQTDGQTDGRKDGQLSTIPSSICSTIKPCEPRPNNATLKSSAQSSPWVHFRGGSRGVTRVTSHPPPGAGAYFIFRIVYICYVHTIYFTKHNSQNYYFNEQHNYFILK